MVDTQGKRLQRIVDVCYSGVKRDFAEELGVSPQTIYLYLKDERNVGRGFFKRLLKAGFNPEWVETGEGSTYANNEEGRRKSEKFLQIVSTSADTRPQTATLGANIKEFFGVTPSRTGRLIPVHSVVVHCGTPHVALDNYIRTMFDVDKVFSDGASFVEAAGDSMRDAGVEDGDMLLVKGDVAAQEGDIIVARLGDELTLKRIKSINGETVLYPDNPDYEPITIVKGMDFSIVGVVIQILKDPRRKRK